MKKFQMMALFTVLGAMAHRLLVAPVEAGRKRAEEAAKHARRTAEERTYEMMILKDLAEILNQTLPPENALGAGLNMVAQKYGAKSGWLLALTAEQKADLSAGYNLPPNMELARYNERPWALCNCMRESFGGRLNKIRRFECERLGRTPNIPEDEKQHLSIPIRASGKPVGILNLVIPPDRVFTDAEIRLLSALGDQFGGAMERARLFNEVQKLAITDPLTGLFNRRHFFSMAENELERSKRYQHPISLAILDIDHFKKINDTYGHLAGDQVLVEIARLCKQLMRRVDTIARFGGEEIVILMPETSAENAFQAMERLRSRVEALQVETPRGSIKITASVGMAWLTHNSRSMTGEDLFDRADQALYLAKNSGRNQVRFAEETI